MITIVIGGLGSGKTLSIVRRMAVDKSNMVYYSNIIPTEKGKKVLRNNRTITADMIVHKELLYDDKGKPVITKGRQAFNLSLNTDFWKNNTETKSVVLDEFHTLANSRKSMTKLGVLIGDFLAMLRRALNDSKGQSELIVITQLIDRFDWIVREMAQTVIYCRCHYIKSCLKCGFRWQEHNDFPELIKVCPECEGTDLKKSHISIECWHFSSVEKYELWHELGKKTFHNHYLINDAEFYMDLYDTFQWTDMLSQLY